MTNSQIIQNLTEQMIKKVNLRMAALGLDYEEAKEDAKKYSVAGEAVWEQVDAHFGK